MLSHDRIAWEKARWEYTHMVIAKMVNKLSKTPEEWKIVCVEFVCSAYYMYDEGKHIVMKVNSRNWMFN